MASLTQFRVGDRVRRKATTFCYGTVLKVWDTQRILVFFDRPDEKNQNKPMWVEQREFVIVGR